MKLKIFTVCFVVIQIVFIFHTAISFSQIETSSDSTAINLNTPILLDPAVTTGQLDNSLRYYIRENKKPENRAQIWLAVNAGSVLEDDDQQGLAHFVEHMAFNGTEHFAKHEIIDFLESIGMEFGPEINAYTNFDETVYMLEVPTDSSIILEKTFQILEDWAHLISFEEEEIDKERGVIIEEWRSGRGAEARMFDKQLPVLFNNSRYAERLTIGKVEVIDTCHYETLRRFYKDWYRPDLMAVIAVGDFEKDQIQSLVEKYFANLPTALKPRERVTYPVPDHKETLFAIATDPEATQTRINIYHKLDLLPEKMIRDFRRQLLNITVNSMLNNRLDELTQKPVPPYLYGFSGKGKFVRSKEAYYLGAGVEENGILLGLETVLTEAKRVQKFGFTQTELDRLKKQILRGMEQAFREKDKTESHIYAGEYLSHFLENRFAMGVDHEYELTYQLIPKIELDEVNNQISKWIRDENRVITVNAPEKEGVSTPSEENLLAIFEKVNTLEILPYVDRVSDVPLISTIPLPAKINQEKTWDGLGVTEWVLSNGIRVVLKPTDFKNDEIQFVAFSSGGTSLAPDSNYVSATAATAIITESGLGPFDLIELQKKLTGKIVRVNPFISSLTEGLSGECSIDDMETMFQLIYLYTTSPKIDSTAYLSFLNRMKGFIENRNVRPETAFNDTVRVTIAQYHHRARPWSKKLLDEIDLEKSFQFYQNRFADAGDFTFIFVGNFSFEDIKPFVTIYLGGLPVTGRTETWKDPGIKPPKGVIKKTVHKGIEPKSRVRIIFTGPFDWSRDNLYAINSMIEVLQLKLREVIREDSSGTYGVSVNGSGSIFPRQEYRLSISFGCNPIRVDELIQSIFNQIQLIQESGIDESYVSKVKEIQLNNYEVSLKRNSYWINALYAYYFRGQNPELILNYPELVNKLTVQIIKKSTKTYFNFDNFVQVVLLPEKNEEKNKSH